MRPPFLLTILDMENRRESMLYLLNSFKIEPEFISNSYVYEIIESLNYLTPSAKLALKAKLTPLRDEIDSFTKNGSRYSLRFLAKNNNLTREDILFLLDRAIELKESAIIIALIESWPDHLIEFLSREDLFEVVSLRRNHPFHRALVESISSPQFREIERLDNLVSSKPILEPLFKEVYVELLNLHTSGALEFDALKAEALAKVLSSRSAHYLGIASEISMSFYSRIKNIHPSQGNPVFLFKVLGLNLGVMRKNPEPKYLEHNCQPELHYKLLSYTSLTEEHLYDSQSFATLIKEYELKGIENVVNFLRVESSLTDELIVHSSYIRRSLVNNLDLIAKLPILSSFINSNLDRREIISKLEELVLLEKYLTGPQAFDLLLSNYNELNPSFTAKLLILSLKEESSARRALEFMLALNSESLSSVVGSIVASSELTSNLSSRVLHELFQDSALTPDLLKLLPFIPLRDMEMSSISLPARRFIAQELVNANFSERNYETFLRLLPTWDGSIDELSRVSVLI